MVTMNKNAQILLEKFYEEEKTWWRDCYGLHIVAIIILAITMMMFILPCQIWEGDYTTLPMMVLLELLGLECEMKRYFQFQEDGKTKSVYMITRYLPIARREIIIYALRKLLKLCLRLTEISLGCQIVFSLLFLHTVAPGNLLMPLLCCFLFPMLILGSTFLWRQN